MKPLFAFGYERSGTTLLRLMLDNHPEMAVPLDVTGLWERYHRKLDRYNYLSTMDEVERIVEDLLAEERILLWGEKFRKMEILKRIEKPCFPDVIRAFYELYALKKGKAFWGTKDPGNIYSIHLLNEWFPDCKFLHIIRDGRDCGLSASKLKYRSLLISAEKWRESVEWARKIGRILGPERYYEFKYEDLVDHPEEELKKICGFMEIDFHPDMLAYHRNVKKSIPDSKRYWWPKISDPPDADNKYKWKLKMPVSAQVCFEKRAGALLEELGYETGKHPRSGAYLTEMYYFLKQPLWANKKLRVIWKILDRLQLPF